jgi:hypothetical protein
MLVEEAGIESGTFRTLGKYTLLEDSSTGTLCNTDHNQCTPDEWQYVTLVSVCVDRMRILFSWDFWISEV